MYCSDTASPDCMTISNAANGQWIQYCAAYASTETVSYSNPITGGSQADAQAVPTTSSSTSQNFMPQPSQCQQPPCGGSSTESSSTTLATAATSSSSTASSGASTGAESGSTQAGSAAVSTQSTVTAAPTGGNATVSAASTTNLHSSKGLSRGVIAGIICGAAAAGALVGAALWHTRKRWLACFQPKKHDSGIRNFDEKHSSDGSDPSGTGKGMLAETQCNTPSSPTEHYSPDDILHHSELDSRAIGTTSPHSIENTTVRGLGIGSFGPQRYAPANPDPLSATDEGSPTDYIAPLSVRSVRPGISEAPTDRPLPASPPVSSLAAPDTPHTNASSPTSSNGPVSPLTPTYRYTPYTPSAYGGSNEPPSSVPRTVPAAPPSLPQDYSAVSLGSMANIYRGLSLNGGAPWAYLSPEEAVRGGWRNEDGGQ
ncbi:hypothetical protein LTR85_010807 [Meristemomyces frigidus]|nr:hypothetical protein LTR85_010807 [Meristemomyces frigidus]